MIYAGTKTADGTLWLAAYEGNTKPSDKPAEPGKIPGGVTVKGAWHLSRVTSKPFAIKQFPIPASDEIRRLQSGYYPSHTMIFSGIAQVDGALWLTGGVRLGYYAPFPFLKFTPSDEQWRVFVAQNFRDYDAIPDAALRQPLYPRSTMLACSLPWRFPDWFWTT